MKKRVMTLGAAAVLMVGLFSAFAYAHDNQPVETNTSKIKKVEVVSEEKEYKDMTEVMKENSFEDTGKFMEGQDYETMDNFMNSLTDEDYDKMIDAMKNNAMKVWAE